LTIAPVLSWNNDQIEEHIKACIHNENSRVLFGGKPLKDHSIPDCYGSYEPTAVELSIKKITKTKVKTFFKELFGPF